MQARRLVPVYVAVGVVALCALVAVGFLATGGEGRRPRSGNPMGNPPGMVDRLMMVDTAEAFSRGTMEGVDLVTSTDGVSRLVLREGWETKDYPKKGVWTSDEIGTEFGFTELIPSWNVATPGQTGVYFEVRSRDAASGEWSPWMYIGYWGRVQVAGKKVDHFKHGTLNSDNLTLDRPADAYQIRAVLQSFEAAGTGTPAVRRVAVCYSGVVQDEARRERLAWKPQINGNWAVDLGVPFRAQGDSSEALAGQICSPTSTSMVMQYQGVDRPTIENALAIYDNDTEIFGNWGRAVARAGELGLDAWIMRFRNWDQVKAMIAAGQPIICSIKAKKGDFQGPHIYASTPGHLIVIRGLTPDGGVIVNDPARRSKGNGFVYTQADIGRVWMGHGGVGYIIRKPAATTATTRAAVAGR